MAAIGVTRRSRSDYPSATMIRIFGSFTSPYVRRVRIVCEELGLPFDQVDSTPPEGQAELRKRNPIWKVPAAEVDGQLVLDSHVITELLLDRYGGGKLAPLPFDDLEARNAITVIDGALDALINTFYLEKEGVTFEQAPYLKKQRERAANALSWLDQNVHEPFVTSR
jgi:glutathione S-transferase